MRADILNEAEGDLERAYEHYKLLRPGLGAEMVEGFRRGVERILTHSNAWQPLYRRCRLRRFPYGIVYRLDAPTDRGLIVAVMHLSQRPDWWRSRE